MDFSDIIYRNNNYVENLHTAGNNENKSIICIQQFYIPKHLCSPGEISVKDMNMFAKNGM